MNVRDRPPWFGRQTVFTFKYRVNPEIDVLFYGFDIVNLTIPSLITERARHTIAWDGEKEINHRKF